MKNIRSIIKSKYRKIIVKTINKKNKILASQTTLNLKGKFNNFVDSVWINFKSFIEKIKFRNVNQCNTVLGAIGLDYIKCENFTPETRCEQHKKELSRDCAAYHLVDRFRETHSSDEVEYFEKRALIAVHEHVLRKKYRYKYDIVMDANHKGWEDVLISYYSDIYKLDDYIITNIQEEHDRMQKEKDEFEEEDKKQENVKPDAANSNSDYETDSNHSEHADNQSGSDSGCDIRNKPQPDPSHSDPQIYDAISTPKLTTMSPMRNT